MKKTILVCLSLLIMLTSCGGGKFINNVKKEQFVKEFSMTNEDFFNTLSLGKVKYKVEKPEDEKYSSKDYALVVVSWSQNKLDYKVTFLCDKNSDKVQFIGLESGDEAFNLRSANQKLISLYNSNNSSTSKNSPLDSSKKYAYYSSTIFTIEEALEHYRHINEYKWSNDKIDGNKVVRLTLKVDPVSYLFEKENSDLADQINKEILGKFITNSSKGDYLWKLTDNSVIPQLEKKRDELSKDRSKIYSQLKDDISEYLLENWNIRNRTERNIANAKGEIANILSDERTIMIDLGFSIQLGDVNRDVIPRVNEYLKKRKEYSFTSLSLALKLDDDKLDSNSFNIDILFELSEEGNYKPASYIANMKIHVEELDQPILLEADFNDTYLNKIVDAIFNNRIISKPY